MLLTKFIPKSLRLNFYNSKYSKSNQCFKTYSQFGEDAIIKKYFPEKIGKYVDVGGGHPIKGNNSFAFYKLGWVGAFIEPLPQNIKIAKKHRKYDEIYQNVVSNQLTSTILWEFTPYQYSTTSYTRYLELSNLGIHFIAKIPVISKRLSEYNFKATPADPYFLSVDCEGLDLEVLKSNNFNSFSPRVICVEDFEFKRKKNSAIEIFLNKYHYTLVDYTRPSAIYLHDDYDQF